MSNNWNKFIHQENVFELIVKESMNDRYSLSDTLIAEGYADPAPSSKLINGVLVNEFN